MHNFHNHVFMFNCCLFQFVGNMMPVYWEMLFTYDRGSSLGGLQLDIAKIQLLMLLQDSTKNAANSFILTEWSEPTEAKNNNYSMWAGGLTFHEQSAELTQKAKNMEVWISR